MNGRPDDWIDGYGTRLQALAYVEWDAAQIVADMAPFCEIDAEEFEAARRDPATRELAEAADRHLETLRKEGRLSPPSPN